MAFNIDEFTSEVSDKGIQRTNKFSLLFPMPSGFLTGTTQSRASSYYYEAIRNIPIWCTSGQLPGMAAQVDQLRRYGYGPVTKVPLAPVYEDIIINVMMDAQSQMWNFFYAWKELTIATNNSYGLAGDGTRLEAPYDPFEVGFRNDYATNISFTAYNDAGYPVTSIVLRDAYPVDVGAVKFDWGDKNRIAIFPVLITYQDWYPENPPETAAVNNDGTSPGPAPTSQIPFTPPIQQVFNTTATRTIS